MPTIQEITALRRSGNLQEALDAAETEFARSANIYTANALFWCLKDLAKTQEGEALAATFERMKSLYDGYCTGNELMQNALATISHRLLPHFQELNNALEKAKSGQGNAREYQGIVDIHKSGGLDVNLYSDFGWLIYYVLKHTPLNDANSRKQMLFNYLALELPTPSKLHSRILGEAVKVEQNTPLQFRIRDFMRLWGFNNLREEDWEQYRTEDGKILPSLVEKLIGVYAKELKTDGVEAPEEFSELIDTALIRYPESQNMPYFKATALMSQGRDSEALDYYKSLILRFPSKFYLWNQASNLVADIDTKVGMLSKALTCGAENEYLGGVRLRMASLLVQKGLLSNARLEIEKYQQTYQANGWRLKPEFWQLYNQLISVVPADSNNTLYSQFTANADEFIYSSLPTVLAVKVGEKQSEDRFHPGKKITTWTLRTDGSTVRLRKPTKYGLNRRTRNGATFDVKLQDNKIVWIKEHTGSISATWLKEFSGEVNIRTNHNGKKYAIIANSYIGETLLRDISDGQTIKILAIQQEDNLWNAISVLNS